VRPFWRDFHTATAIGDVIYVFGGRMDLGRTRFTGENFYSNDLYAFNVAACKWTELHADTSHHHASLLQILGGQADLVNLFSPCGRRSHSAVAHNNKLLVFGGYQENIEKHFNDMYEYDTQRNEWRIVEQQGVVPSARRRHSCNVVGSRMLIFGGTGPREVPINRSEQAAGAQYDELLARLPTNNQLNRSIDAARVRILQQFLNEHEQERLQLQLEQQPAQVVVNAEQIPNILR
jgi:hypothetical protein